jgi:hypothetical protein
MEAIQVLDEPLAVLERAFVEEFLHSRGYTWEMLEQMPKRISERLLAEASEEASLLLARIDSRWNLLKELHGRR